MLIVYSLASGGVSVTALFMAGYIPGILTGVAIMLMGMGMMIYKKEGLRAVAYAMLKVFMLSAVLLGLGFGQKMASDYSASLGQSLIVLAILAVIAYVITSYSIHYTKLYDNKMWEEFNLRFVELNSDFYEQLRVITSYSIHYTKLYEISLTSFILMGCFGMIMK